MQAGASKQGIALATKYADAVYSVSWNMKQAKRYRERLDSEMAQRGHQRYIKVFPGLVTYVGHTHEEALKKTAIFLKNNLDETLICFVNFAQKSKGET